MLIEPLIKSYRVSNNLRRKTVTLETNIGCLHRLKIGSIPHANNLMPINLKLQKVGRGHSLWRIGLGILLPVNRELFGDSRRCCDDGSARSIEHAIHKTCGELALFNNRHKVF